MNKIKSKDETILGINCFDELLFESDIRTYANKYFSKDINIVGFLLLFYSKRLNLCVYK
jgi:hypothetical protein